MNAYFRVDTSVAHLYKITNKKTGEYYIGKHCGLDQRKTGGGLYWGSGERIKNSIRKYGKDNFVYEILVTGNIDYIINLESKYVTKELIEEDVLCMNLMTGGIARRTYSKDSIEKAKRNRKPGVWTEEQKHKLSVRSKENKYALGREHTDEAKQKLREYRLNQTIPEETEIKRLTIIKSLVSMNNGIKNIKVRPEFVEDRKNEGYTQGWLPPKFSEETIQKLKNKATQQWAKRRQDNTTGVLEEIN
jgi:hypothetical protein